MYNNISIENGKLFLLLRNILIEIYKF